MSCWWFPNLSNVGISRFSRDGTVLSYCALLSVSGYFGITNISFELGSGGAAALIITTGF